jgi:hypothetical protein
VEGEGRSARFGYISHLTLSPTGAYALVVDSRIRRIVIASRVVTTIATGLTFASWLDISRCSLCQAGTFSSRFDALSCTLCGVGAYQSGKGLIFAIDL